MRLSETPVKKSENLHLMRFIASVMVIFGHSYALSGCELKSDFVDRHTNGIISIGGIVVTLFFLCSGYLISKSVMRTDKFLSYIKARIIRLLPPLAFVVFAAIIVGAVITRLSPLEYFTSLKTYKYLLNAVMIPVHELPGVFENNAYDATVNGALWTLPVEFACYIACYIFYKSNLLDKKRFWYTAPFVLAAVVFEKYVPGILGDMVRPCVFFYIGMFYYVYREHIVLNIKLLPLAAVLLTVGFIWPEFVKPAMIIFWPYVLFTIWFALPQCPKFLGNMGNISYGVYLWGFFVQQLLVFMWGGSMPRLLNFVLGSAISIYMGTLTFYITEKPFSKKRVK